MADGMKIRIDMHRMVARTFVASKGRLPEDQNELGAWLMEFTSEMGRLLEHWQEVAHAAVSLEQRPLVIEKQK